MSARPWYAHYPTDFVHGVVGLGAAEIGAYIVILDLIYDHGRPIVNDPKWIGGILGESSRSARALIGHLIEAGKLIQADGTLDNTRAKKERETSVKLERNSSERSANAARARWSKHKDQALSDATSNASRAQPHPEEKERIDLGDQVDLAGEPKAFFLENEIAAAKLAYPLVDVDDELRRLIPWAQNNWPTEPEQKRKVMASLANKQSALAAAPKNLSDRDKPVVVSKELLNSPLLRARR